MILIKIIRSSVKPNPKAGSRHINVMGAREVTFKGTHNIHPLLKDGGNCVILQRNGAENTPDFKYEGALYNIEDFDKFFQDKDYPIAITVNNNIQRIEHLPEPMCLYRYENPELQCGECNKTTKVSNIDKDYDDDGNVFYPCPCCNAIDSFPSFQYENINDVLNELELC